MIDELWVARPDPREPERLASAKEGWARFLEGFVNGGFHDWAAGPLRMKRWYEREKLPGGKTRQVRHWSAERDSDYLVPALLRRDRTKPRDLFTYDLQRLYIQAQAPAVRVLFDGHVVHFEVLRDDLHAQRWGWKWPTSPATWPRPGAPDDIAGRIREAMEATVGDQFSNGLMVVPLGAVVCQKNGQVWEFNSRELQRTCECAVCVAMRTKQTGARVGRSFVRW